MTNISSMAGVREFIEQAYDLSDGSEPLGVLPMLFGAMRKCFSFSSGIYLGFDPNDWTLATCCLYDLPPELERIYTEHYYRLDPYSIHLPNFSRPNEVVRMSDFVDVGALRRSEFGEGMRLVNYAHCMAIVPSVRGLPAGGFGVHRPAAKHDFTPKEEATLRWFACLAARAMDYRQLATRPRRPGRCAMIVAPAEGRVIALSDGLRAILAQLPEDALLMVPPADASRSIWRAGGKTYAVGTSRLDANSVLNSTALAGACFDPDPQLTGRKVRLPRGGGERMVVWVEPLDDAESLRARIAEFDLSPRLRQVALLMALGRSTKAIARECGVSANTAKEYVADVYERLDVHTREAMLAQLARVETVREVCPGCSKGSAQPSPARRRSP